MERKLTRSRSRFEEEEESEEDMDRRSSTRINKGDNEQPGTSTQNSHNQRAQEQRCWHVSCGNKKGILHIKKLKRGKACINSEDCWFEPRDFEVFGGKASNKKWKYSICRKNKPLQFWLEQASITTKVKGRRTGTMKQKKILSPYDISESLSEEIQSAEETEKEEDEDEDWLPGSEEFAPETEEEEETTGARNGEEVDDSGVDESKEGEDEMEEEDMSATDDEERETEVIISRSANGALQKKLKVAVERLPEATRDCQTNSMEHQLEVTVHSPTEAQSVVDCKYKNNDAAVSGHDAAQLQAMMLETRATQTCRPSESPQPPNKVEDLDTMDLDQLKREKIKMKLKVLKLKDQYYTLKIKEIKK